MGPGWAKESLGNSPKNIVGSIGVPFSVCSYNRDPIHKVKTTYQLLLSPAKYKWKG
jgi:hypothetical protein